MSAAALSPVLSRAQMRAVDGAAVARTGLPSLLLMENAGRGVADAIIRRCAPQRDGRPLRVVVVCGAGNNGGDGFVVARHLAIAGAHVRVLTAARGPAPGAAGDPAVMFAALSGLADVTVEDLSATDDHARWTAALAESEVVVDALFGTGLRAGPTGAPAAAIAAMNAATGLKVAVDIPSGLDADSGRPLGPAFRADVTVTMGARKWGLVLEPDTGVGAVEVAALGVPVEAPPGLGPSGFWLDEEAVRAWLPRRGGGAHKGTGGHLLVVAGSAGKTGAALLVGRAALRVGAGLVTIASTAAGQVALDAKVVEAMTASYASGDDAAPDSFSVLAALASRPNVRAAALGPGIPTGPAMPALCQRLARELAIPLVVDADGLNMLGSGAAATLKAAPAARIVTPHPGEMARLAGCSTADVQADRLGVARAFAAASGATVVLKGARTLVVMPDGTAFVNPAVEPALATAGSGDVLTGVVGGLLAQGMEPVRAACAGVFIHGCAGTLASRTRGSSGVIAGDLPDSVAAVRAAWAAPSTEMA